MSMTQEREIAIIICKLWHRRIGASTQLHIGNYIMLIQASE